MTLTVRFNFALLQGVTNLNKAIMDLVNIEVKWPSLEILIVGFLKRMRDKGSQFVCVLLRLHFQFGQLLSIRR